MSRAVSLCNCVRKVRQRSQMSQKALAELVGVTRQTIIAIEMAKSNPSLEIAFRIARVFGLGVEELFQNRKRPARVSIPLPGFGDPVTCMEPLQAVDSEQVQSWPMDIIRVDSEELLSHLVEVDYSFTVQEVADPPFDGPDVVNTRTVTPFLKTYFLPTDGYRSHSGSSRSALFLGMKGKRAVGFIAISLLWNGMTQIDDLAVDTSARHWGVGSALLARAIEESQRFAWTGIRAETQSLNLPACRFYRRHGFELCGFDRRHYGPRSPETALFWYLP